VIKRCGWFSECGLASFGAERFRAAWILGRALVTERAVQYALETLAYLAQPGTYTAGAVQV